MVGHYINIEAFAWGKFEAGPPRERDTTSEGNIEVSERLGNTVETKELFVRARQVIRIINPTLQKKLPLVRSTFFWRRAKNSSADLTKFVSCSLHNEV